MLAYYPEEKLTVIVLGNLNGSAPQEIASKLAPWSMRKGRDALGAQGGHGNPKLFNGYIGRYELARISF